jgi:hypothetical protein
MKHFFKYLFFLLFLLLITTEVFAQTGVNSSTTSNNLIPPEEEKLGEYLKYLEKGPEEYYNFLQTQPVVKKNTSVTSTSSPEKSIIEPLDIPVLIKNNVRAHNVIVTKAILNSKNELEIEGTVEIKNYAETDTSRLYMSAYTGIKGTGYYLQYPFFNESRGEAFILKPQESVIKDFKIVENNFLKWGTGAVEIFIQDEYSRTTHKEIGTIPFDNLQNIKQEGEIFNTIESKLSIATKKFPLSSGPTFKPEEEDLYIELDFGTTTPSFIENFEIHIYDRNFFTKSIKSFTVNATYGEDNLIKIQIPEDLSAGVYPFQVITYTNNNSYVPRMYGRFIVDGNMGKTTDVSFTLDGKKVSGLTLTVQGNPPNITSSEIENEVLFDAEITVFGKNEKVLYTKKIEGQDVQIYRNIDVNFEEPLSASKIEKVVVTLSGEKGVFNTFEKEFDLREEFNYWNIFYGVLVGAFLVLLIKFKYRKELVVVFAALLLVPFFADYEKVSSQASGNPSDLINFGSLDVVSNVSAEGVKRNWGDGEFIVERNSRYYINNVASADDLLSYYGINISVLQPNPNVCYVAGSQIYFEALVEYTMCSNHPITDCLDPDDCDETSWPLGVSSHYIGPPMARNYDLINLSDYYWGCGYGYYGCLSYTWNQVSIGNIIQKFWTSVAVDPPVRLTNEWLFEHSSNHVGYKYWQEYPRGVGPGAWSSPNTRLPGAVRGSSAYLSVTGSLNNTVNGTISTTFSTTGLNPGLNVIPLRTSFRPKSSYAAYAYTLQEVPVWICPATSSPLTATCAPSRFSSSIGDPVTYTITVTNASTTSPITYSWGPTNSSTFTYSTSGSKTENVTITNGGQAVSLSCNAYIEDFSSYCSGSYTELGEPSQYTANPKEGATYQWLDENDQPIPGATSQTYSTTYGAVGSYPLKVITTKNSVDTVSDSCYATVYEAPPYCSGNYAELGEPSEYTVNLVAGATYQWLDENDQPIPGETSLTYSTTYGEAGSYPVRVEMTRNNGSVSVSDTCWSTVSSCGEEPDSCVDNQEYYSYCDGYMWNSFPTGEYCSSSEADGPNITTFKFVPNIVNVNTNTCKLNLVGTNVQVCRMFKNNQIDTTISDSINAQIINFNINTFGSIEIPIGTYTLGCTGTSTSGELVDVLVGSQKCMLNPDYREN